MAAPSDQRLKLLRQAAGLATLQTGYQTTPAQLNDESDLALRLRVKDARTVIDNNLDMPVPEQEGGFFSFFSLSDEPAPEPVGTKDNLNQLIDRQLANEELAPHEVTAVKAAMSVAAYDVDLEQDTFSPEEIAALGRFNTNIDNNLSLTQIANSNFITATETENRLNARAQADRLVQEQAEQAALEAAALEQQTADALERQNKQIRSLLVAGGYLDEEDQDPEAAAWAMRKMITIVSPDEDHVSEQTKIFTDFETKGFTPYALEYAKLHLSEIMPQTDLRTGDLLREQLESGDPKMIELAQGYLATTNPDVQINGVIDQTTLDAANAAMRAPLTIPSDLIDTDGSVRLDNMMEMAVRGQLYLPVEALSEEEQAIAMSYPLAADREPHETMSREKFIALRLLEDDSNPPAKYQAVLDAENARRAASSLDVEFDLPAVVVEPGTPLVEEIAEIAKNPTMLVPVENNDAVSDAAQPIVDHSAANAIGITTQSHILVFEGNEIALEGVVAALKQDQGSYGDGVADNMISMTGAINLVRGAVGVNDQMGFSIPLSPDDVAAVNASLGYEPNQRFDVTQPHDMAALLKGITTYQDVKAAGVPFTDEFIEENTTVNHPDVDAAIKQASGVTPQPAAPEAPETSAPVASNSLPNTFKNAALGVSVMTPPEIEEQVRTDRKLAANTGPMAGVA